MEYERINTVQLHGLTLGYRDRVLFTDAGIGFGWGEFTALIGRNGTGKSTLLRTIAGLSRPLAGHITVNGRRTDEMSRREIAATIAFVSTEEVKVNVIHKAVGGISESDVLLAEASDAIIVGFQVRPTVEARKAAEREGIDMRLYSVIYDCINEVKDGIEGMLEPEKKEEVIATAEVKQTFRISKVGTIAGCLVRDGKMVQKSKVRLIRDGIVVFTGELGSLQIGKDAVKEVIAGKECGMSIAGYNDIKEGDVIEAFQIVEIKRTL